MEKVKIATAAKIMDRSAQFVRKGLQKEILPFGVAVKIKKHHVYHINTDKFCNYPGITPEDLETKSLEEIHESLPNAHPYDLVWNMYYDEFKNAD